MSKYLVTGGAGFIGSHIVEGLLNNGHTVRVLDNFSTGKRSNLKDMKNDIDLIEGDIRSYHIVQDAVKDIDYVLHQAALPSVPRSINDPLTTNEVNIVGTLNLLQASRDENVERFVFASSSSIYGDSEKLPKDESMKPNPKSPYAVSKLTGEYYCRNFKSIYDLETVILRYFNVFGPRQDPNSQYSAVIPKFMRAIKNQQQITVYGDGEQTRDFTYVKNVVKANMLASKANIDGDDNYFNVACGERTSLNSIISVMETITGNKAKVNYTDERRGDVKHSFADITRIKEKLDYEVIMDVQDGLNKIRDHY